MNAVTNKPKISIVIPSLNQGEYIQQTIDSLLNQHYPSLEVIIIDGLSTDNTISVLKSYDDKIRWVSEKDSGQTQAINKGFNLCTGDLCGYLNSDDYLLPGALEKIAQTFEDDSVSWVTGNYLIVNEEGVPIQKMVILYKQILRIFSSYKLLQIVNFIVQPSTFWRRAMMEIIGEFNERLDYVMDYDYWLRAYQVTKPTAIRSVISAFRIHAKSKGGSQYEKQFAEELVVLEKYTMNRTILMAHRLHNFLIVFIYNIIKQKH